MGSPFIIRFCWLVAVVGYLSLAVLLHDQGIAEFAQAEFCVLLIGVVVGELLPVRVPLRGGDEEMSLSTPFTLAILMSVGLAPAIIAQAVAGMLRDVIAGKPMWRGAFNFGQYALALTAAGGVLTLVETQAGDALAMKTVTDIGGTLLAGAVFFCVRLLIAGIVVFRQGAALRGHFHGDFRITLLMAGVSISLAPLVLVAVQQTPFLLCLFLLPFAAVHTSGRLASITSHQALHDGLTGLPNRARFRQLMDRVDLEAAAPGRFAVMVLDLDRFKEINDTLGHHYGDLVLTETTARLQRALGDGHVLARLGGDEFAVLTADEAPARVAERLSAALQPMVELDGFLLEVDASIGIARCPEDGTDVETLLRRADVAMYTAKQRHLDHLFYCAEVDEYDPARLALVTDLRRALKSDELVLSYQPKLDLRSRRVVAVEALVRWQHPRLGLLQPAAFVEIAEHTGLIKPLTQYVLRRAIGQCAAWQADGWDLQIAVNVSPRSLLDRGLAETVAAALRESGLAADRLKLEITETAIMVDPDAANLVLGELAAIGVGLSVDDFGTGYSSLAYLRQLPFGEVKIDRSFVRNMMREDGDHAIVRSTIDLAANLGLTVVAEGVEDSQTLEELSRLGCHDAQGYFVSRPIPGTEVITWLAESRVPQQSYLTTPPFEATIAEPPASVDELQSAASRHRRDDSGVPRRT